jgi:alkanesulfonate monooxygenase SsuD/methylene tetrahydromethanopterin reductase-like flavin-dependent oxidoreductase (luciferase family)
MGADRMKAGVGIDPGLGLSFEQQRTLVQEVARLGYDSLWMPAGATARSAFQTSVRWWQASCEVVPGGLGVGISVVPFPAWTAPTLAAEAASVGEVTGGKFSLGIGLGGYTGPGFRRSLGLADFPPVALTRDYLHVLRGLLAGEEVDYTGRTLSVHGTKLAFTAPPVPVYLAALGPQMLRLAGALADGVTPNWSSPEQIVWLRQHVAEAARAAGRDPAELPFAQYIRVCVDEDVDAARRAFCAQVLGYAMARPGQPTDKGYRAHFGRMGFEELLTDLEARRDAGAPLKDLLDLVPVALLERVGYFGAPAGAADALRRLSHGLDEAMVRLISVRSGDLDACLTAVQACQPSGWR